MAERVPGMIGAVGAKVKTDIEDKKDKLAKLA
jgi:hypothetical protein